MHYKPRWLVDDNEVFVFEHNIKGDVLAPGLGGGCFGHRDNDALAGSEFLAGIIHQLALDRHTGLCNQLLKTGAADVWKLRAQEFIEAQGGQIWVDSQIGEGSQFGFILASSTS